MSVRGIRGAITVTANNRDLILEATEELLRELLRRNEITDFEEIVSAIFTTTEDLNATFPAEAARKLGMSQVPLLCAREIPVPERMPLCIRILMHLNTDRKQNEMVHVYLREARKLRPDIESAQ